MFIELADILVCPRCRPEYEGWLQGLVVVVEEMLGRRVLRGWLGCPACEAQYRIRDGVADFAQRPVSRTASAAAAQPERSPQDPNLALQVAALLAVHEKPGPVLLGTGLERVAGGLSRLMTGHEVIVLTDRVAAGRSPPEPGVSPLAGVEAENLPLRDTALAGAALAGAALAWGPPGDAVALAGVAPTGGPAGDAGARAAAYDPLPAGASPRAILETARVVRRGGRVAVLGSVLTDAGTGAGTAEAAAGGTRMHAAAKALAAAGLRPLAVDARAAVAERG